MDTVASASAPAHRSAISRSVLVLLVGCAAIAFVYRYQIGIGFSRVFGERYDGLLSLAILEHWYTVVTGAARGWHTTFYFYPAPDSLGYSEALAGLGLVHAAFRIVGVDPILASELAALVFKALGFFAFYWMLRRVFAVALGWSLFGATLFTISSNLFIGMVHTQFTGLSLAPLLVVLLARAVEDVWAGRTRRWTLWLMAAVAVFALGMTTSFYVAWYFVFLGVFCVAAYALLGGWPDLRGILVRLGRHPAALAVVALWTVACLYPFFRIYLPIVLRTGGHPPDELLTYAPRPAEILNATATNPVWSWLGWPPAPVVTGFTPVLLALAITGLAAALVRRPAGAGERVLRAVALAVLATWPLVFRYGDWTPWRWVYDFFPGGTAIRVTHRYQFFLTVPLVLLATVLLARLRWLAVTVPLAAFVLIEQRDSAVPIGLDRPAEMARLRATPKPPSACKAFFAMRPREGVVGRDAHGYYSHNVDAMVTAEWLRLPTINGFGTFTPPGWNLLFPSEPDYGDRVAKYAAEKGVSDGLCGFDFATLQWSR